MLEQIKWNRKTNNVKHTAVIQRLSTAIELRSPITHVQRIRVHEQICQFVRNWLEAIARTQVAWPSGDPTELADQAQLPECVLEF